MTENFTGYLYVQMTARTYSRRKWFGLAAIAFVLAMPGLLGAQGTSVQPRITAQIDESKMNVVTGNLHPLARPQNDQGKADPSLKLERVTMMFQPTAAQKADLEALLAAQQNPTSPSFHQWLTPQQYGDRFGITQADLNEVTAWLQAKGFVVVEMPPSRNLVVFSGNAGQVQTAFHTEIHNYAKNGLTFYSNSAEPSVPAALAGIVAGFRGLNNYRLLPRTVKKKSASSIVRPDFTSSITGNHFVTPGDFATIYDLNSLYSSTPPIDGTGQKIVVVGQSNIVLSDIAAFRTASGLSANVPTVTLVPGSSDPGVLNTTGDEQESSIDIEWAGAVARNATIVFVYANPNTSGGAFSALQYAIVQNVAPVISVSYGGCEATFPASDIDALVALAQQANSQGITIATAVGDGGATDCDAGVGTYPATLGLNVDFPGSMPYVTGVGGTEFNEGNGAYWQPQSTNDIISSALSYIPEKVWNDTLLEGNLTAGGGGASSIFGKPSWQTGSGVPADGVRDVPDISVNASPAHDGYLACLQFIPSGGTAYTSSCLNGTFRYSDTSLQVYGGTSFGGPTFAGLIALINQKTGSAGQANVNYILYPLAASSRTSFHDITTGDNTSPCVLGTENCPSGGSIGFTAGTGYDQATGLGSVDGTNLVNAWSSIATSAGSTPTLSSISPASAAAGSASFTLTATGSNFATTAQILWNGSTLGVTTQPNGTPTSIKATISSALVAYGTTASVTVVNDGPKTSISSAAQTFAVTGVPPANDNIANAIAVTSSNFVSTVDNSAATTESTDPTPSCATTGAHPSTNARTKTVWWSLTAGSNSTVLASTIGSVYDTTLSVWTGTPGSLTNVACNDDISSGVITQSQLMFSTTAGTKYYIMVAPFGPPDPLADQAGGKTVLNVSNANPSQVSASPSSQTVAAGSSATYTITNTGNVTYTLTCTGLPTGATCSSASVAAGMMGPLVITTTSRTASAAPFTPKEPFNLYPWAETTVALGISVAILFAIRKRRVGALIPASALLLLLGMFVAGCGSSSGSSGGSTVNPNGTPAGTYTITVTGTSGAATQATTITLVVT